MATADIGAGTVMWHGVFMAKLDGVSFFGSTGIHADGVVINNPNSDRLVFSVGESQFTLPRVYVAVIHGGEEREVVWRKPKDRRKRGKNDS